jgi:hypothetical protein
MRCTIHLLLCQVRARIGTGRATNTTVQGDDVNARLTAAEAAQRAAAIRAKRTLTNDASVPSWFIWSVPTTSSLWRIVDNDDQPFEVCLQ